MSNNPLALILLILILFLLLQNTTLAQDLSSPNYKIDSPTIEISTRNDSSANQTNSTDNSEFINNYKKAGYLLRSNPYQKDTKGLSIEISEDTILHPNLSAFIPSSRSIDITIEGADYGYKLKAAEDNQLKNDFITIPDTSCDQSPIRCSVIHASAWKGNSLGFGYNVSSEDGAEDFIDSSYYRPFPNLSQADGAEVVAQNYFPKDSTSLTLTTKIVTVSEKDETMFTNQIYISLIPNY